MKFRFYQKQIINEGANIMIKKIDKKNKFVSVFDSNTGFYMRTGVIENGKDTKVTKELMLKLASVLDTSVQYLFFSEEQ